MFFFNISGEPPARHDPQDIRPKEGGRHLRRGGRDAELAGRADRVPNLEISHLQVIYCMYILYFMVESDNNIYIN